MWSTYRRDANGLDAGSGVAMNDRKPPTIRNDARGEIAAVTTQAAVKIAAALIKINPKAKLTKTEEIENFRQALEAGLVWYRIKSLSPAEAKALDYEDSVSVGIAHDDSDDRDVDYKSLLRGAIAGAKPHDRGAGDWRLKALLDSLDDLYQQHIGRKFQVYKSEMQGKKVWKNPPPLRFARESLAALGVDLPSDDVLRNLINNRKRWPTPEL